VLGYGLTSLCLAFIKKTLNLDILGWIFVSLVILTNAKQNNK